LEWYFSIKYNLFLIDMACLIRGDFFEIFVNSENWWFWLVLNILSCYMSKEYSKTNEIKYLLLIYSNKIVIRIMKWKDIIDLRIHRKILLFKFSPYIIVSQYVSILFTLGFFSTSCTCSSDVCILIPFYKCLKYIHSLVV
jgi:hypothetical protein